MNATLTYLDERAAFLRERLEAAERDVAIYEGGLAEIVFAREQLAVELPDLAGSNGVLPDVPVLTTAKNVGEVES